MYAHLFPVSKRNPVYAQGSRFELTITETASLSGVICGVYFVPDKKTARAMAAGFGASPHNF